MKAYAKTIVAVLLAVSTWGVTAFADGNASAAEWFGGLGAVASGFAVYWTKNTSSPEPDDPEEGEGELDV